MSDGLTEELAEDWFSILNDFQKELGTFVIENGLEEDYPYLLMVSFSTILENGTKSENEIIKFAKNFLAFCKALQEDGKLNAHGSEERYQEAIEELENNDDINKSYIYSLYIIRLNT